MPLPTDPLAALQTRLGYTFRQPALLVEALTHPSYLQDHPEAGANNQRLEFLGDSVLQFLLTDALFHQFPGEREGVLSRRRATLSKGDFLSRLALGLDLSASLRLSRSEADTGGRQRASIAEDAFEAIVGAIYLDSDVDTTRRVVLGWYGSLSAHLDEREEQENPKGRLQELVQPKHGNNALRYVLVATTGPHHAHEYEVSVSLGERLLGTGNGSSKKLAEEAAARQALHTLREG